MLHQQLTGGATGANSSLPIPAMMSPPRTAPSAARRPISPPLAHAQLSPAAEAALASAAASPAPAPAPTSSRVSGLYGGGSLGLALAAFDAPLVSPSAPLTTASAILPELPPPSKSEVAAYAILLGIDPEKEPTLLFMADMALRTAPPHGWEKQVVRGSGEALFVNAQTGESQPLHPLHANFQQYLANFRTTVRQAAHNRATAASAAVAGPAVARAQYA